MKIKFNLLTKTILVLCLWLICITSFAQSPDGRMLFVIDSIPLLTDPEDWNQIMQEDIADFTIIKDKDSLKLLGWERVDGITYIFTKEYRNRPDSLKRIPSLKQMKMNNSVWELHNRPYTGRYIDYYNNGRIQNEGTLSNGKLDGTLTVYFKNGSQKSVAHYSNGTANGLMTEYYKNGTVMQTRTYSDGKQNRTLKLYFINGQLQHEVKLKKETRYDTAFAYYSTGKVKQMWLVRNDLVIRDKKEEEEVNYYTPLFYLSINNGDLKEANKHFYKIWMADSTSIDTHFKEGLLLYKELRYDDAIAELDKALKMEPLMRESLTYRGLARLKKYQPSNTEVFSKDRKDIPLVLSDMGSVPPGELEKACSDLQLADNVDFSDYYVKKMVPEAILNYCREKNSR